jgi:hypothetical protein
MRGAVEAQRKPESMFEEFGKHRLPAPMGKPVGVKCDKRAANNHEKAKANPGCDQRHEVSPG